MSSSKQNYQFQKIITVVGILLFIVKVAAWYITHSVAILTDALESTVNVTAGFLGLYSLYLSARPKDRNHPYGHGKAEFVSAAVEGTLIGLAGIIIIYEAISGLLNPNTLHHLDYGLILIGFTAIINYLMGHFAIKKGKENNSLALIASGKHLQSDTYSTAGLLVGLLLIIITKIEWLDSAVALVFALLIIYTGYKIIRDSLAGIMDEADTELLTKTIDYLQQHRRENWVDLHNLRIIKYGGTLHLDCHLTIPWYMTIHQGHREVEALDKLVKERFGESVELFVHTDGCLDFSCRICDKKDCIERKFPFERKILWTFENVSSDLKHQ